MQKKFFENLIFLVFVNLLIKPLWVLGVERNVQNVVGEEQYGIYFSIFNLSFILNILLDMGINTYNTKLIASNTEKLVSSYLAIAYAKIGLAIGYMITGLWVGKVFGYEGMEFKLLMYILLNQVIVGLIAYNRSCLVGLHLFVWDSFFSVFDKMLLIVLTLFVLNVMGTSFTILDFALIQTACMLVAFIASLILIFMKQHFTFIRLSIADFLQLMRDAAPYALMIFLMSVYYRADGVLLNRLLPDGNREAGIYAAGYRVYDAISNILILFGNILLPLYARYARDKIILKQLTKYAVLFIVSVAMGAIGVGVYFRTALIDLLYHHQQAYWIEIYVVLLCSVLGLSLVYIYGSLLTALGKIKMINFIVGFGVLVNIVANLILIPQFKALGAAMSFFITQTLMGLLHLYFGKKHLDRL
jgi:O-antigen/teichoic acid export membrane protein